MKLHTQISIGLVAGAIVGVGANIIGSATDSTIADGVARLRPFGDAWIRAITAVVIPLVVASLVVGAASLGDMRTLGRMGGKTIAYYMATTAIAVSIGLVLSNVVRPGSGMSDASREELLAEFAADAEGRIELARGAPNMGQTLLDMIPSNPIAAAAEGDMLPLILFTLVFGAAASMLADEKKKVLIGFFDAVNHVSMTIIHWIMKLAPFAVFALIAAVTARFGLSILQSLTVYALTVVAGLAIHAFVTYGLAVKFLARLRPLDFFRRIREVQLLGFSTSSSNATLPVTIATAEEKLGVSTRDAGLGRRGGRAERGHHYARDRAAAGERARDRDRVDPRR